MSSAMTSAQKALRCKTGRRLAECAVLLALLTAGVSVALSAPGVPAEAAGKAAEPGERRVLYKVKENATGAELGAFNAVVRKYALQEERKLIKGKVSRSHVLAEGATEPEAVCVELRDSGAVDFAEPDLLIPPDSEPNDPSFVSQWFHGTIGTPSAWDSTVGSRSVVVGVCDTGIESSHPDLSANLRLPGFNTVDGSTNTEPVMSHGTSVAGCIGAVGNNGTGVSGVNWSVSILPVRISNRSDGYAYYSDMAEGIRWAADEGARVVNLSYDGAGSSTIDYAARYLRDKGGLLFIAAGNSGADRSASCPDSPYSLAVGATTSSDTRASYSNYGTFIDCVAPGSSIYTTSTRGGYASVSGTSFASPVAAGVAALVMAANPSLSAGEVESCILSTCVDLGASGDDNVYGHGRVNVAAAVAAAGTTVPDLPPTADAFASPASGSAPLDVTFDGSGSSDADGTVVSYAWDFGDGSSANGAFVTHRYPSAGKFTARLTVRDNSGSTASDTVTVDVAAAPTRTVYVGGIGMTALSDRSGVRASAAVLVVDAGGAPVSGAAVSVVWSGAVTGKSLATTGRDGVAALTSNKSPKGGSATLTVTNVSAAGCTYDPARNLETSDSVALPKR